MHCIVFIMVLFLSACSLTPEMTKPAAPVPEVFTVNGETITASTNPTAEMGWREMFIDKRLQALIELALINKQGSSHCDTECRSSESSIWNRTLCKIAKCGAIS